MSGPGRPSSEEQTVDTGCSAHCGGKCLLRLHLKDGKITAIETDESEPPVFRACPLHRAYRQVLYHPERLKSPLRRIGERGEGKFEAVSWDSALDTIAEQIRRVQKEHGPGSILALTSGGDLGVFNSANLVVRLLNLAGGCQQIWGYFSYEGGLFASLASYGDLYTFSSRDDLLNSRTIILWGIDPAVTTQNNGTMYYLAEARDAGARITSVDPRFTDTTASVAHQWIPIRPSTDTAMLIAMAYVIITEGLQDQSFIDTRTVGFDQYKRYVLGQEDGFEKAPSWAEAITGVPADKIAALAREFATRKPAALIDGIGPGRTALGEQYHRAAIALAAITGNIGIHGGNAPGRSWSGMTANFPFRLGPGPAGGANPCETPGARRPCSLSSYERFVPGATNIGRLNRHLATDAILRGKEGGYPQDYKLLYVTKHNYIGQQNNVNKSVMALKKVEFMVVHEQFMTATARFADIVLPISTFLESNDLSWGGGLPAYVYMKKVIDRFPDTRTDFEIFSALAKRLGISNFSEKGDEDWVRSMVESGGDIPDYETFKDRGIYKVPLAEPHVAFEKHVRDPVNNPFPTPSGKIEIFSESIARWDRTDIPPVPKYSPPPEGHDDPLRERYPLQLLTPHSKRRAHSVFETVPWLRELQVQAVTMNPRDASQRDIKDWDTVRVFNDRGTTILHARLSERIMPGVVDIPQGAWYCPDASGVDKGGCCNVLTKDGPSPGGAMITNTCLVQVSKAGTDTSS